MVLNPPGWEVCLYVFGFLVLFAVVIVNLWKLYKSGSFPTPSPYPNFHYRYLQEKYGSSHSEIRQKVSRGFQTGVYKRSAGNLRKENLL